MGIELTFKMATAPVAFLELTACMVSMSYGRRAENSEEMEDYHTDVWFTESPRCWVDWPIMTENCCSWVCYSSGTMLNLIIINIFHGYGLNIVHLMDIMG